MKRGIVVFCCFIFIPMATVFGGFHEEFAAALKVPDIRLDQNDEAVLSKVLHDPQMRQLLADYNFSLLLLDPNPEHFVMVRESLASLLWSMLSLSAFLDVACQKTCGTEAADNYLRQLKENLDQLKTRVEKKIGVLMLSASR